MPKGEFERIDDLARRFAREGGRADGVVRGIGDDAAILDPAARGGGLVVWTVDAQVEGVHFRRDLVSMVDCGYRAFMAAASDLAAMGARPWCALSSIVLPPSVGDAMLGELADGQAAAAREVEAPIVGGNLARGDALSITTTLLGTSPSPVSRAARAGDAIWIAGDVGLAAAGLALLLARASADVADDEAVRAWRRPRARIGDGLAMAALATGAIDVSDGLAQDLGHLARAGGVRAVVDTAALLAHGGASLARAAALVGRDAVELALHGGEDYALVAASASPLPGFTRIGVFDAGSGVALRDARGVCPVEASGFDHFKGVPSR